MLSRVSRVSHGAPCPQGPSVCAVAGVRAFLLFSWLSRIPQLGWTTLSFSVHPRMGNWLGSTLCVSQVPLLRTCVYVRACLRPCFQCCGRIYRGGAGFLSLSISLPICPRFQRTRRMWFAKVGKTCSPGCKERGWGEVQASSLVLSPASVGTLTTALGPIRAIAFLGSSIICYLLTHSFCLSSVSSLMPTYVRFARRRERE